MATAACPWEVNVSESYIKPVDFRDLPPKERERFMKDQKRKEKTITKQEVIEDLTYYVPDSEENYDERDAPSAFSALFGKSSSNSTKSCDSDKSNKSIFRKFKKGKKEIAREREREREKEVQRVKDEGGEWRKIP